MIPTTAAQICEAVQGALFGDEHTVITDVSTDSRTISAGAWFVPLAGERFDGHDYIDMALDRGRRGASAPDCRGRSGTMRHIFW